MYIRGLILHTVKVEQTITFKILITFSTPTVKQLQGNIDKIYLQSWPLNLEQLTLPKSMVQLTNMRGTVCSLRSQKYNIERWGLDGEVMDDYKECN